MSIYQSIQQFKTCVRLSVPLVSKVSGFVSTFRDTSRNSFAPLAPNNPPSPPHSPFSPPLSFSSSLSHNPFFSFLTFLPCPRLISSHLPLISFHLLLLPLPPGILDAPSFSLQPRLLERRFSRQNVFIAPSVASPDLSSRDCAFVRRFLTQNSLSDATDSLSSATGCRSDARPSSHSYEQTP